MAFSLVFGEEEGVKVVEKLVRVILRRCRGLQGLEGGGGAPPWLGVRERGCERVRVRERRLGGGSQVLGRSG